MEKKHRTWICSVLFMDIVAYTKFDVEEQMAIRSHYYSLVDGILESYCDDDYITIDAGDGMAICYTGDPEDILIMAINLRDAFQNLQFTDDIKYKVRLGINLGPVKIVELQGEKRVIGDAINVANRVMNFAEDNQLLVSRSYYDVVSTVSKDYEHIFKYAGIHEDKHIRKHAVYEVSAEQKDSDKDSENTDNHQQENVAPPKNTGLTLSGDDRHFLETALAKHIGPVARIIVKRAIDNATNTNALLQTLADNITEADAKKHFLQFCKNNRQA